MFIEQKTRHHTFGIYQQYLLSVYSPVTNLYGYLLQ